MYALLLFLLLVGLVNTAIGYSKENDRQLAYQNRRQKDSSMGKVNLSNLKLLRKYDNILTSMHKGTYVARDNVRRGGHLPMKRNTEHGVLASAINDEVSTQVKRRENTGDRRVKDWSNKAADIVSGKYNSQIKDWSAENDNIIGKDGYIQIKDGSAYADNVIGTNAYKQISMKAHNVLGLNGYKENKYWPTEPDDSIVTNDYIQIKNWPKGVDEFIKIDDNKEINDLSIEPETNGDEQIKDWSSEADDLLRKGGNDGNDGNMGGGLVRDDDHYKLWVKRNGKGVIESIEQTLGLASQKEDEENMLVISPEDVRNTGTFVKPKKMQKEKTIRHKHKKPLTSSNKNGIKYRPWIKQRYGTGKRSSNGNDLTFSNYADSTWVSEDDGVRRSTNNIERKGIGHGSEASFMQQKENRVNKEIVRNLEDTVESWGKQYDNRVGQDINDVKSRANDVEKRRQKENRNNVVGYIGDKRDEWEEKDTRYAVDDSDIDKRNLIIMKAARKTENQKKDANTRNMDTRWVNDIARATSKKTKILNIKREN